MAPIRVAMIGLSASATGTGWAATAHLPYLQQTSKYTISALCNSSIENAEAAIKAYNLPSSTKAYGTPEDLARDPDIDLVVCNTRVDKHYDTLLPSINAGKSAFSEWPLASNLKQAQELASAAKSTGAETMVGLQGRQAPVIKKAKEIIESGKIGKVLSSTWAGAAFNMGHDPTPSTVRYMGDRNVGGNLETIHFGHSVDYVLFALGSELESFSSILGNQRPEIRIMNKKTEEIIETMRKDTPDNILLQGRLSSGALLSFHIRGGPPFLGEPGIFWRIYGSEGEIAITAAGALLSVGYSDVRLKFQRFGEDVVEMGEKELDPNDGLEELPLPARNIGRCYEAFADGKEFVTFQDAVTRHALLDEMDRRESEKREGFDATYTSIA